MLTVIITRISGAFEGLFHISNAIQRQLNIFWTNDT